MQSKVLIAKLQHEERLSDLLALHKGEIKARFKMPTVVAHHKREHMRTARKLTALRKEIITLMDAELSNRKKDLFVLRLR